MAKKRERANGEGSVYPRRNKEGKVIGYRGAYWVRTPEGYRRRHVSAKTKTATRTRLRKAMEERDRGFVFHAGRQTVGEYLDRWLEDSVRDSVGHRTYHNYRSQVRLHVKPEIGEVKLKDLTPQHVQRLYRSRSDAGLSPASVRYVHAVLRRAMAQAVRWKLVSHNPCEATDPPKIRRKEIRPLDSSETRRLLEAARDNRLEALFVVAVACGLRAGELLGLKRQDLDLPAGTLRVNRQIQRSRDGNGLYFSEPKNASRRTVGLPETAADALRAHLRRQAWEKRVAGELYRDEGMVFASEVGTPLDASNVVNRSFKPLLRRVGLPEVRFHDLRHTCATLLLARGVHPKFVQALLGHSSIGITMDLYSHWAPAMGHQAASAMDDALRKEQIEIVDEDDEGEDNAA